MKKIQKYTSIMLVLACLLCLPYFVNADGETEVQKEGIFSYTVSGKNATITNVQDTQETVVIPEKINDYTVTALASGACGGSAVIREVIIPDTVTEIGATCFAYSTGIQSIKLPASLSKIESGTFSQCTALRTIEIPAGIKSIENDAFYRCDELWTVTLPEGLLSIGENAFAACPNLAAATVPASVTAIGKNAFQASGGFRIYAKPGTAAQTFAAENGITFEELITVSVNGTPVVFDQPPVTDTKNYRTLVPMRAVLSLLGAEISWDNSMNMAGIDLLGNRLLVRIGEPFMMVNGKVYNLSSPAVEFNSRTLLPIRDIIESVGGKVSWNEDQKHIDVTCTVK